MGGKQPLDQHRMIAGTRPENARGRGGGYGRREARRGPDQEQKGQCRMLEVPLKTST